MSAGDICLLNALVKFPLTYNYRILESGSDISFSSANCSATSSLVAYLRLPRGGFVTTQIDDELV